MLLRILKFIALIWLGVLFMIVAGVFVIVVPHLVGLGVRTIRSLGRWRLWRS